MISRDYKFKLAAKTAINLNPIMYNSSFASPGLNPFQFIFTNG